MAFECFPNEISHYILTYLDCETLSNAAAVSHHWRNSINNDHLWQILIKRHGIPANFSSILNNADTNWLRLFSQYRAIESRILQRCTPYKQLMKHGDSVYCVQIDSDKIVTGSRDCKIKIWDMQGRCTATLQDHTSSVLCLRYDSSQIFSGSSDGTILCWDLSKGIATRRLKAHENGVSSISIGEGVFLSCSIDGSVKLWQKSDGEPLQELRGHARHVNSSEIYKDRAATVSGDRTVRVWDLNSGRMVWLSRCNSNATAVAFHDNTVIVGCQDGRILGMDLRQKDTCLYFNRHRGRICSLKWNKALRFMSGGYDACVKVWDIRSSEKPTTLRHDLTSAVYDLDFNSHRIVCGSQDGKVHNWDFGWDIDTELFV